MRLWGFFAFMEEKILKCRSWKYCDSGENVCNCSLF